MTLHPTPAREAARALLRGLAGPRTADVLRGYTSRPDVAAAVRLLRWDRALRCYRGEDARSTSVQVTVRLPAAHVEAMRASGETVSDVVRCAVAREVGRG